tara:strand:+ start:82 stop:267 length:186 start_codon:yes stop_codon:yes gene_type:complete
MNNVVIENAQYFASLETGENISINCKINGKDASVPLNSDNTDYAEIMRQVEAGELTIQEAD